MLKQPLPGRARRWIGAACVAAIVAATSFAAWAAQPAQISVENPDAPAVGRIHADIVLLVNDAPLDSSWASHSKTGYLMRHDPKKYPSDWEMGLIAGHPFSLEIDNQGESWKIDGTVQQKSDGTFELNSTLTHNGSVVSRPKLIARDGEPAGIKISEHKDDKFKGFAAQFVFHDGSGPVELPSPDADIVPTENESYRRITRIAYPQSAITARTEGLVYIDLRIGTDGKVVDAKVNGANPMAVAKSPLADAALAAVKTWTFNARRVRGRPVATDTAVVVVFSLDPGKPVEVKMAPDVLDAIRVSPPQDKQ